jgi:ABC-type nitrate/sulfonate/bicarbonate transport system permease component
MTATVQLSPQKKSAAPSDMYEKLRPKSKRLRNRSLILGVTGIVLGLLIWQILASSGVVSSTFSSSPIGTASALWTMLTNGTLWAPVAATLASFGIGMAISIVFAIPIGLILGRAPVLRELVDPWINILNSVPYVVFLPLIIFWFGIDETSRIVLVVWSAAVPLLMSTIGAARNLDRNYMNVATVFSASRGYTLRTVAFPAILPYILSGIRLAVGRGLVGAIVAELFLGAVGLGSLVQVQTSNFEMDEAMATVTVIAIIAILINQLVGLVERRFAYWADSS